MLYVSSANKYCEAGVEPVESILSYGFSSENPLLRWIRYATFNCRIYSENYRIERSPFSK
jgi:hypothetical protein